MAPAIFAVLSGAAVCLAVFGCVRARQLRARHLEELGDVIDQLRATRTGGGQARLFDLRDEAPDEVVDIRR
jgi:hypothetical protein